MRTNSFLALATLASATLASNAQAHIDVEIGGRKGRDGDQKEVPCDGARGDGPIFTFEPGATITLNVVEGIPHPGYFRIAFDEDGEDFQDPRSIKPVDATRKCKFNDYDQCGESDHCNTATVLVDNIAPHEFAPFFTSYEWTIKLPDVECDNCTLQIVQVMEDTVHGAYCPFDLDICKDEKDAIQDNYHRCFDLKLQKGATNAPGASDGPESLPADKKYVSCSKQGLGESADAGRAEGPAGEVPSEAADAAVVDVSTETASKTDAGAKSDAGVKNDASTTTKDASATAKDASATSNDEEPAASDDGCALASSSQGAAWTLLALGLLLARRRRRS